MYNRDGPGFWEIKIDEMVLMQVGCECLLRLSTVVSSSLLTTILMLLSIQLERKDLVAHKYQTHVAPQDDKVSAFLEYIKTTWLNGVYKIDKNKQPRTNNHISKLDETGVDKPNINPTRPFLSRQSGGNTD